MKLASLKHGRDGRLIVVSRNLKTCADASAVAPTLQAALDDWNAAEPRLTELSDALEAGRIAHLPFDEHKCAAPLPRSFGWADGSAYVNHVALVRRARGAELPASFWTDPLMYRGGSDGFLRPARSDPDRRHRLGRRSRSRGRGHRRRRAAGRNACAMRAADPPAHDLERRQPAQSDRARARQRLRLPAEQGPDRVLARRGDP
jgi:hypothetical protein